MRSLNEAWVRICWNACAIFVGEVSVGKHSITLLGEVVDRFCFMLERDSGRRARRAIARFPWVGEERIRAIPVP